MFLTEYFFIKTWLQYITKRIKNNQVAHYGNSSDMYLLSDKKYREKQTFFQNFFFAVFFPRSNNTIPGIFLSGIMCLKYFLKKQFGRLILICKQLKIFYIVALQWKNSSVNLYGNRRPKFSIIVFFFPQKWEKIKIVCCHKNQSFQN